MKARPAIVLAGCAAVLAAPLAAHPGRVPHPHPHHIRMGAGRRSGRTSCATGSMRSTPISTGRTATTPFPSAKQPICARRLRSLREQFQRLNANGLTRAEVRTLQDRTNYIRSRLRMERIDWDRHAG